MRSRPTPAERTERAASSAMLRQKVLSREFLSGAPAREAGDIRCVVMDWNVGNGVASLVAFDDGSTSLYFSSGGGVIGAGAHEAVKRAATVFREEADKVHAQFSPTAEYPLPPAETSVFYVVTDSATLTSGPISNSALHGSNHPLSALARTAQEVITQVRKAS